MQLNNPSPYDNQLIASVPRKFIQSLSQPNTFLLQNVPMPKQRVIPDPEVANEIVYEEKSVPDQPPVVQGDKPQMFVNSVQLISQKRRFEESGSMLFELSYSYFTYGHCGCNTRKDF